MKRLSLDSKPIEFVSVGLHEKLRVVCEKCNSGWMSGLTARVKERFSETVINGAPFSLSPRDAALLASFTFMKAAVKDYCYRSKPFFTVDARKKLRLSHTIPPLARFWFAAFQGTSRYSFKSNFNLIDADSPGPLFGMEFFCYTYIFGQLVLQLLAPRWKDIRDWPRPLVVLDPHTYWQQGAVKFWPYPGELHWPPEKYLGDSVIEQFIYRFNAPVNVPVSFPVF